MKILLVHNHYGSSAPSGENVVFESERDMLRARAHEVHEFTRTSDELRARGLAGMMRGALAVPWNPWSRAAIRSAGEAFGPDIVHAHNLFPLISPSIWTAVGARAARVMTLHNYRLFCPAAIPARAGNVCTECLDRRSILPALRHACYRDSRISTVPLAAGVLLHRVLGTWRRDVDAFITLSEFQKERMVEAGLPRERVHVKPNFYPGSPAVVPYGEREPYVVFVGRLSREKGVETLLRGWQRWGADAPELRIVGDGPDRANLERLARGGGARRISFLGQVAPQEAVVQIARARLLVLPSEWFEGFPMVVREAYAHGTPVAASRIGPLPEIVREGETGAVFAASDPESLHETLQRLWGSPERLEQLSRGARRRFEARYTEGASYATLMEIYARAIAARRARRA